MIMNNRMTERFAKMRVKAGKKEIMCISSLFDGFEDALVYYFRMRRGERRLE